MGTGSGFPSQVIRPCDIKPAGAFHFKLRRCAFDAAQGTQDKDQRRVISEAPVRGAGDHCGDHRPQNRKRLKLHLFLQPLVYPGRVALLFDQSGGQRPPHFSRPRCCASLR